MYSINQSEIIIKGKLEEIRAHLMRLDKESRKIMTDEIIRKISLLQSSTQLNKTGGKNEN
jgi:hypothetical protein